MNEDPDFNDPAVRGRVLALGDEAAALLIERDRMLTILNHLGFCPKDGEPMPCFTCGAGL